MRFGRTRRRQTSVLTFGRDDRWPTNKRWREHLMNEVGWRDEDEISLFALATTLLRDRWRIARWTFLGGALAALAVFSKPALYRANASFMPQTNEPSRSGLSTLAGQFGLSLPVTGQT